MSRDATESVERREGLRPVLPKRRLDTVVKMGLGVFIGSFALIWGGMFLTRPDRTIPPFSVGAQEDTSVAIHVPPATSDAAIETLIRRFQAVSHQTRNFGPMKIHPTTPHDSDCPYRHIVIYIFTHDAWAEPDMLHRYLHAKEAGASATSEDQAVREGFEKALRGLYKLEEDQEEGRIGPLPRGGDSPATAAYTRQLFKERVPERKS